MSSNTIDISGKAYPFVATPQGAKLLQQLNVNIAAVRHRHLVELEKYIYCIVAGAAQANGLAFDYTVQEFIHACPANWMDQVNQLINEKERPAKVEAPAAQAPEKAKTIKAKKKAETPENS